ncbi:MULTISPECIES: DUF4250 domain-containing protein [unclassified Fusobacterium]|uniref:DUF4250 domain-containing protein n=1 Tax=unclassified Fusobacterium TaxID=2648384 RepID=UPI0025C2F5E5|nr:DUF4250 domain-containing protein [Fusobacterium sp.]
MKNKYLTMDINIAYSMLNMRLRDKYSSLSELCEDEDIDMEELLEGLKAKGVLYNEDSNQFTQI